MNRLFHQTLPILDIAFTTLERQLPPPQLVNRASGPTFRYIEQSVYQAIILKLVRVVSGLRAALLLLEHGFVQEQAVYHRVIDELNEDILFLVYGITNDEITPLHKRFLKAFYEEEFDESDNPLTSPQKRDMIPRKKIRAYLAKIEGAYSNPSDTMEVLRTLSKAYSGFVHAASIHIMDMYGGNPRRFHLSGMLGTPRIKEYSDDLWNYYYRCLLSFVFAAKAFGDKKLVDYLEVYIKQYESISGTSYSKDIKEKP